MIRSIAAIALLALVAAAAPVPAGEHAECDKTAEVCLREMAAKLKKRGWVGIEMDYTEEGRMKIVRVIPESPAEIAGFQAGDVVTALNGIAHAEENKAALKEAYGSMTPGQSVTYTVSRGDEAVDLQVRLGSLPETVLAQWVGQHMLMAHVDEPDEEVAEGP